jgi:formamidopyrimidine-DNA glycosylase
LGIDPLGKSFNYSVFLKLLKNRSTSIKNFLTNDDVLFGIGKVYADEICFEARINPNRGMKTLKKSEINRIYTATKKMLKKSMEYDGLSIYLPVSYKKLRFDRFLKVYEREGEKCKRCNGTIKKEKIVKPTYFFCPLCQN